jgi:hypothetical protein
MEEKKVTEVENTKEEKVVYSYHTFLYPFLLKDGLKKFCKDLPPFWKDDDMITKKGKELSSVKANDKEEVLLNYQTFQYFNPAARKALFESDSGIVSSYKLRDAKGGTYTVTHTDCNYDTNTRVNTYVENSYQLDIDAIRLKVFNTDVAVISFELEYRVPAKVNGNETVIINPEQARKDVKAINEFGRRLYPEFLLKLDKEKQQSHPLCADKIDINLSVLGIEPVTSNLRNEFIIDPELPSENYVYLEDPIHLPNIITELINADESKIEPAIDDRMFVCCCILDSDYGNHFIKDSDSANSYSEQSHKWKFIEDWETGCELYALINVDASSSSCQNRVMLDKYFEEQLYLRWLEYGTIHAVTNHSMFCITSPRPDIIASVVNPFLIEYVPICILGLAQRASLLSFDDRVTDTIKNAQGAKPLNGDMLDKLIALAEDFAIFQGQLLLSEVTPQIQGIEIYERVQNMLFIPKLEQNIQNQLNNLYQIAEANRDKADDEKDKRMQGAFTAIAILSIFSAWVDSYGFFGYIFSDELILPLWRIVLFVVLAIVLITFEWWYEGYFVRSLWKSIKERWKKSKDKKKTKGDKK